MTGQDQESGRAPGRAAEATRQKRFYTNAVASAGAPYQVLLDGRVLKTPARRALVLPNAALAEAVADEWAGQGAFIDPISLPVTRIVNSAVDGVAERMADVADEIVGFAGNDLICYRAESPVELVARQVEHWDALLAWAREALGLSLRIGDGVMPITQSDEALQRFASALPSGNAFQLAAMHVMTTLTGSAIIALAHARGYLSGDAAWAAAHVDEDYQISQWGADSEAMRRRKARRVEFDAASFLYRHAGSP